MREDEIVAKQSDTSTTTTAGIIVVFCIVALLGIRLGFTSK